MAKVISDVDLDFPDLKWAIRAKEETELPTDKDAAEAILRSSHITKVGEKKPVENIK